MLDKDKNYEVGYKKPPRNHQFKDGQSGNPKGRQKAKEPIKRNFDTDFRNELDDIVTMHENGKAIKITKQQAFIKKIFALAMSGNSTAMKIMAAIMDKMPIKDSDMLVNEALKVLKENLDKAKAERRLPPEVEAIYNPNDLLPIQFPKPRTW